MGQDISTISYYINFISPCGIASCLGHMLKYRKICCLTMNPYRAEFIS